MQDLIREVTGSACFATGVVIAALQFRRLRSGLAYFVTVRRHRGNGSISVASRRRISRLRQVVIAPSGFFVRQALLTAACGLWLATLWWPVVVIEVACIVWIVAVWAAARVQRARAS
jgi:uncharacterized membrane protein